MRLKTVANAAAVLAVTCTVAAAEIAVSANDGKVKMVDGVVQAVKDGKDTVSFIDLKQTPPKIVATIEAPTSVVGPPMSVAVSPKEDIALVTAAQKIDPADATKLIWDDKLTVIDLTPLKVTVSKRLLDAVRRAPAEAQPKVLATLTVGKGAAGVSFNKAGTLALVANRGEGTISVLTIDGNKVAVAGKVDLGNDKAGPSAVSFLPDGKSALVTLDGESANRIAVLDVDGAKVTVTKREISAGLRPYGLDVAKNGEFAVVANIGRSSGDADTISMLDLKVQPPRVVTTITVGQTPEGIALSPDGRMVAVGVVNGTNLAKSSPFYHDNGLVKLYRIAGKQLTQVGEVSVGKWCQGLAWSANGKTLLAQCRVEEQIHVLKVGSGSTGALTAGSTNKMPGGPAGIRVAQ